MPHNPPLNTIPAMPDTLHPIIPSAFHSSAACRQAAQNLNLPNLDALLGRLGLQERTLAPEDALSAPHEHALAHALGLPHADGRTPWAAWDLHQRGRTAEAQHSAWAWITPCHWQVRTDHVTLTDPAALQLDETASRALLAVLAPWFAQDGITLHYDSPTRWLAQGDALAGLATASVERVLRRDVSHWLPGEHNAHPLRRLHSEMQMLLYTHPLNDAREAQGLPPVNAFWVHGAGRLVTPPASTGTLPIVHTALQDAALREDWPAWTTAWQALDAGPLAQLRAAAQQGQHVRLTLCGEHSAFTWHTAPRSLGQKIQSFLKPQRFKDVREQL